MRVVGLMSGTSYDGIDVAIADLTFDGDAIALVPLGSHEVPHDSKIRNMITDVLPPNRLELKTVCRLDTMLGQAFADAAVQGIERYADGRADLVVSHGQTVYHWVDEDGRARGSLQLGQPAWIAERTGVPVVSDLRNRDIASGGQGAPLVPMFDRLLLPPAERARAALNIGGIANLTVIRPDGSVVAYDIGPGNALIDAAMGAFHGLAYDPGGTYAKDGTVHDGLLAALGDHPYFDRRPPKSTGKELFSTGYLTERLSSQPDLPANDVVATATEFTASLVATECERYDLGELAVSGGGAFNDHLMERIAVQAEQRGLAVTIYRLDAPGSAGFGIPVEAKEAYAFALLGFLTVHGLPGAIPECTGAGSAAVLGTIAPGREPLRIPEPPVTSPTRLRIDVGS